MAKRESVFQRNLKKEIKERFPGSKIIRLNPNDNWQGIPDLLVLEKNHWAALEVKRSKEASKRLHQDYYVEQMNNMSYASFVCPENKDKVLDDLSLIFKGK